jgi:hypothetical protein
MTRTVRVLLVLLAIASFAAPAGAQDPLGSKVTVDLKAVPPDQAFRVVGNTIGMKVTVDAAVTTPIDILVKDVSARTALTTMCESIGCRWSVSNGSLVVARADRPAPATPASPVIVPAMTRQTGGTVEQKRLLLERIQAALKQPLPAGMKFENAPLSTVSGRLSDALGLAITMTSGDPALTTVTADFSNQSLMTALKRLGGGTGGDAPPLRLTIRYPSAPGGPVTPSIIIGFKMDPKKK